MPTENHEFRQPPRGQTNWDQDWYHNFDTLDERVVARGIESDRTEYNPYENALYIATDTENIFRGTGTDWVQLESFGVNPDFGQASADKVTINNEPTNPTDAVRMQELDVSTGVGGEFSTTGDGTSTTFSWDSGITDPADIQYISIDPSSRSASTDYTRFVDGTSIGVEYDVPPDDGVTLSWFWTVNASVVSADAHDHTGDTLNPDAVNSGSASVSSAPSTDTDVARQAEINSLDSTKADADGAGTSTLTNYAAIDTEELSIDTYTVFSSAQYTVSELNTALSNLSANEAAVLVGTFDVPGPGVQLPSDSIVINNAHLRQVDMVDDVNAKVVKVADDPSQNITFINNGIIDGNVQNQDNNDENRHAVSFSNVTGLRVRGLHIINSDDFSLQFNGCQGVQGGDFYFDTGASDGNQDGCKILNCQDMSLHGIYGQTEDDLFSITVDETDATYGDISITGVQGRSINARGFGIFPSASGVTIENVTVEYTVHDCGSIGLLLGGDSTNTYRNVDIDATIRNPGGNGAALNGGVYENCSIDVTVSDAPGLLADYRNINDATHCEFSVSGARPASNRDCVHIGNTSQSEISVQTSRGTVDSSENHLRLTNCTNNEVVANISGGGRGIRVEDSSNNRIRGSATDGGDAITVGGACQDNDWMLTNWNLWRQSGTRSRWDGVIGGGPFGGVDLSITTGQFEGDTAMSSGATSNTGDNAYSYWTWDSSNSNWKDGNGNTV